MPLKIMQLKFIQEINSQYGLRDDDGYYLFDVVLTDNFIKEMGSNGVEFSVFFDKKYCRKYREKIGVLVSISIEKNSLQCARNIYDTWDTFLNVKANLRSCPALFWIRSVDFFYDETDSVRSVNTKFNHYMDACSLIELLIRTSDYQYSIGEEVVEQVIFLHKSKLAIPTWYSDSDLIERLNGITVVLSLFEENLHREHKQCILKEVLYGFLNNVPEVNRLKYLFEHFGEFSARLNDNYQLFISEFSFDSVRAEYEEKKRDYITKLNDVLSSVQTKMLGIPVSLGFLSLKVNGAIINGAITNHIALFAGIMIYCAMMFILITNQFHTLNAVKEEYTSLMNRLKHKHAGQYQKIIPILSNLDKRFNFQWWTLAFFNVLTIILFLSLFFFI